MPACLSAFAHRVWPAVMYFAVVFGVPWLIWKLLSALCEFPLTTITIFSFSEFSVLLTEHNRKCNSLVCVSWCLSQWPGPFRLFCVGTLKLVLMMSVVVSCSGVEEILPPVKCLLSTRQRVTQVKSCRNNDE